MNQFIIFGAGAFAKALRVYIESDRQGNEPSFVRTFVVHKDKMPEARYSGLPVMAFEDLGGEDDFNLAYGTHFLVAIGDNKIRERVVQEIKDKGYKLGSYICSKSIIWHNHVKIGKHCIIFENQTIQPFVEIGNNVVIWSGNHIGHEAKIGNHCFITSHVVISGHVRIGSHCYLGVNSCIRDGITIGDGATIGMGAVVTKNVPAGETWVGNPAKKFEK